MNHEFQSDEMLLALCIQGENEAFVSLVERYRQSLFAYLCRLTDANTAEDLLQETFVKLYIHQKRFSFEKSFRTWIYTIATNLARNELKSKKRRSHYVKIEPPEKIQALSLKDPSDDIIYRETQDHLDKCLEKLDPKHRTVFVLRFYEKLPYDEIAEIMNCKTNTTRTRMFYALEKIRKEMKEFTGLKEELDEL